MGDYLKILFKLMITWPADLLGWYSPYIYLPLLFLIENQNVPVRRDYSIIKSDNNLQVYRRMLVEGPIRLHKLIKVYKIEGEFKDIK